MSRIALEVSARGRRGLDADMVRSVLTGFHGYDVERLEHPGADEWLWPGRVLTAFIGLQRRGSRIVVVYAGLSGQSDDDPVLDHAECRRVAEMMLSLGDAGGAPVRAGDTVLTRETLDEVLAIF